MITCYFSKDLCGLYCMLKKKFGVAIFEKIMLKKKPYFVVVFSLTKWFL